MGTRVAPSLANAFMDSFEHKFVYSYPTQPHTWIRYIDDIFCIWTRGEDTLDSFINHLNGCHESIKFTDEKSTTQVHFLDTTVIFKDNGITTDLYTKPTDTHNYLRYDSAHNPSVTKGLPYGQFLRLRRICQTNDMYNKHANEMIVDFTRQGYPINLLQRAKEKAMDKDRDALLTQEQAKKDYEDKLFLITTYQPGFGELKSIVQSNWDLLKKSVATKNLSNKQLIVGYRRPKNLWDLLVKAKIDYHPDQDNATNTTRERTGPLNSCTRNNCRYCTKLNTSGRIRCTYTDRAYVAKHNVSCQSNNLIYCITCNVCSKQYVGQTKRRLMDRFQGHFGVIQRNDRNSDIAAHFNSNGHNGTQDMTIHILDFIFLHPESLSAASIRDHIEVNWIHRLHSQQPMGLNIMDAPPSNVTPGTRNWRNYIQ